jgi:hypothetical protein
MTVTVSGHVKSQVMNHRLAQGKSVRPSDHFPSSLDKQFYLRIEGNFADTKFCLMRSLLVVCMTHVQNRGLPARYAVCCHAVDLPATDTREKCAHRGIWTQRQRRKAH